MPRISLVLLTAVLMSAGDARAAYQYAFDQSNYTVMPGQTVGIRVYLQETTTTVFRDDGLIGSGVQIRFDEAPLPNDPAKVLAAADILNVSDFEITWSKNAYPDNGYADLSLGTFEMVYGVEALSGSGIYRILLGKFTFTAGTLAGEATHLLATDFSTASDTVYCRNGDPLDLVALDGDIQPATAMITAAPEPGTLLLLAIAGLSLLGYAWKKRSSSQEVV